MEAEWLWQPTDLMRMMIEFRKKESVLMPQFLKNPFRRQFSADTRVGIGCAVLSHEFSEHFKFSKKGYRKGQKQMQKTSQPNRSNLHRPGK